ncbi:MAG: periplasmic protein TonB [Acidobacteriaceae bacterium]|jgi:TonB family protein|nr:periplasmic protein TonB [Acidobacteriaceae bacterium]
MLRTNNYGRFLAFLLWVVMAIPCAIKAQQAADPKVDPPRAGRNGVTSPQRIYCPQPEYPQKTRKVKIEGTVLLDVTVTTDGQIANPVVLKGPDADLNNKALESVRNWKMKPASGPDGKPVDCRVQVEITIHRY